MYAYQYPFSRLVYIASDGLRARLLAALRGG